MATTDGRNDFGGYWQCHACGGNHSWTRGCPTTEPTTPWKNPQPTQVRRKPNHKTSVVRGNFATGKCNLCRKGFKKSDAVIQVDDVANFADDPTLFHRRCMEDLLSSSIDDEPKEQAKFERYREEIADKYGIEIEDD
jgi:hypothetical protein